MTAREYASITGKLSWLSFGCPQGCTFLASLWEGLKDINSWDDTIVQISTNAHYDFMWWLSNLDIITSYDRNLMLDPNIIHSTEMDMFGDASGVACGGHVGPFWYQHVFTPEQEKWNILHKEAFASLLLLILANMVYNLTGWKIRLWSDNEALVRCMRPTRGVSRDPLTMMILREI